MKSSPTSNRNFRFRQSQLGAATLTMALVLLVLITMVGFYTSRTILLEQKIAANDFRSRQAFEAAESGLKTALAYLASGGGADKNRDGVIDPVFDADGDGLGDSNAFTFPDGSSVTVTLTGVFPTITVQSIGVSDDRTATRTISGIGSTADALPHVPQNPLSSRSQVIINGSATVTNPEGHSTIWSGSDVALGSNNSTATEIADPTDAGYPTCMDTSMTCGTTRSSSKTEIGLDVLEHDHSLANLSTEQMFQNFFGLSSVNYRESRVTSEVAAANVNNLSSNTANPGIDLAIGEIVWVEGDAAISTVTVGCAVSVSGNNVCPLASQDPTILIINGDLTTSGTPQFYGIVFVMGGVTSGGNSTIMGAMVVNGDTNVTTGGSLDIIYNSDLLEQTRDNGNLAAAPGSWRDW